MHGLSHKLLSIFLTVLVAVAPMGSAFASALSPEQGGADMSMQSDASAIRCQCCVGRCGSGSLRALQHRLLYSRQLQQCLLRVLRHTDCGELRILYSPFSRELCHASILGRACPRLRVAFPPTPGLIPFSRLLLSVSGQLVNTCAVLKLYWAHA